LGDAGPLQERDYFMTSTTIASASKTTMVSTDGSAWINRKASQIAHRAATARQKSGRRRLVDPATCEREYSAAEIEFMQAIQDYKKASGRMFPTWSEVLEVVHQLGYQKAQ
jgi:hypothetical protein